MVGQIPLDQMLLNVIFSGQMPLAVTVECQNYITKHIMLSYSVVYNDWHELSKVSNGYFPTWSISNRGIAYMEMAVIELHVKHMFCH